MSLSWLKKTEFLHTKFQSHEKNRAEYFYYEKIYYIF